MGIGRRARTILVLALGSLAVVTLALAATRVDAANEDTLLERRAGEAGAALEAVLPVFQVPLSSAAAVAEETDGSPDAFTRVADDFVGGLARSAALWVGGEAWTPRVELGEPSAFAQMPAQERAAILGAAPTSGIGIVDLTDQPVRAIGFAVAAGGGEGSSAMVAYFEAPLPEDPTSLDLTGDAFDDLDYAVYLGGEVRPGALMVATTNDLPLDDGAEQVSLPWGDSEMQVVFSARGRLGPALLGRLPALIGLVGGALVLAFTWLTSRLGGELGRTRAEASDTQARFLEQRTVARTLQRDLLPAALPEHPSFSLAHAYEAGVAGIDVGGDWYDAVLVDDRRLLLSVGDVSGQGLPAATVMMGLRTAVRAHASQGDGPAEILTKLSDLLDVRRDEHFATVLCVAHDLETRETRIASAGHPPPVVVGPAGDARLIPVTAGPPVGVRRGVVPPETEVVLEPGATLVAFTDGLFERRGEVIDVGLERVRATLQGTGPVPAEDLVAQLTDELRDPRASDDTAVLALRVERRGVGPP